MALAATALIAAQFLLTSPAYRPGGAVPSAYTCEGAGGSPPLRWKGVPAGTRSFALRVYDRDARNFTHWLAWNIPAKARGLRAGQKLNSEGTDDFGWIGWGAFCPPSRSKHRFVFVLYALARPMRLSYASGPKAFTRAVTLAKPLAKATLVGTVACP